MRIVLYVFGVVLGIIVLLALAFKLLFGVRFRVRHSEMRASSSSRKQAPLALVRVLVPGLSASAFAHPVEIRAYNQIYAAIGVTQKEFAEWENRHEMGSTGTDKNGNMLAPGFPVLSRVAWMYIDPVTLTPLQTAALLDECERAILSAGSASAKQELADIRALAKVAVSKSAVVEFGHP